MRAEAQLANGALELPTFGIAVTGGAGRFALADGTLRGSELAGAIGKSTFTGGTLAVDLIPDAALRKLEAAVDADLAGTLPIVRRLVGRPEPAALANVESLRGRASGTVAYETDRRRAHVAVDLSRVQGNVRYRGVPLPIEVTGGAVRYAGDRLDVRRLDGSLGRSQVRAGAMELVLGRGAHRARRERGRRGRARRDLSLARVARGAAAADERDPQRDRYRRGAARAAVRSAERAGGARLRSGAPTPTGAHRRPDAARAGDGHRRASCE